MEPGIYMLPPPAFAADLLACMSAFDDEVLPPVPELEFTAGAFDRVDGRSI